MATIKKIDSETIERTEPQPDKKERFSRKDLLVRKERLEGDLVVTQAYLDDVNNLLGQFD